MQERWTVLDILRWTEGYFGEAGLPTPRLDAEVLLAHALGTDRVGVYLAHDRPLVEAERAACRALVAARARGEPVAYLTGHKEFYGLDLAVDPRVLVPRPETEGVVDRVLEALDTTGSREPVVADVGTGSGALACAVATQRPSARVVATEIDPGAAAVAAGNVGRLVPDGRVTVVVADLLGPVRRGALDVIASNPPYVATGDPGALDRHVAAHEPAAALFAGSDGLACYRRLLPAAARCLRPSGWCVVELGAGQAVAVTALAEAAGLDVADVRPDLAGIPRVLAARARGR